MPKKVDLFKLEIAWKLNSAPSWLDYLLATPIVIIGRSNQLMQNRFSLYRWRRTQALVRSRNTSRFLPITRIRMARRQDHTLSIQMNRSCLQADGLQPRPDQHRKIYAGQKATPHKLPKWNSFRTEQSIFQNTDIR